MVKRDWLRMWKQVLVLPDVQCRVEGEAADGVNEAANQLLPAAQEAGGAHGLHQLAQQLSSGLPDGRTAAPEEQRDSQRPEGHSRANKAR